MSTLAQERNLFQLIRFAFPSAAMMLVMSFYTLIDGFFVSNYAGSNALASLNIGFVMFGVVIAIGMMFASGGNAYVAFKMGEGKVNIANRSFTFITLVGVLTSIIFAIPSIIYAEEICRFLGADDVLVDDAVTYMVILLLFAPLEILQCLFQVFFTTAGKPKYGFMTTLFAGVVNAVLDYVFIVHFEMGVAGAALATAMGFSVPAITGLIFFTRNKNGLRFMKPIFSFSIIAKSMFNGSSEMIGVLSSSITITLFNIYMMRLLGPDGVAAITAALYFQWVMISGFLGFGMGLSPIIAYQYGMKNTEYLKKAIRNCALFVFGISCVGFCFGFFFSASVCDLFFEKGTNVYTIAYHGLKLFSFAFLFAGTNIFVAAIFTALGNGIISGAIAMLRTLIFLSLAIIGGVHFFGEIGLWLAVPVAEFLAILFCLYTRRILRKNYDMA